MDFKQIDDDINELVRYREQLEEKARLNNLENVKKLIINEYEDKPKTLWIRIKDILFKKRGNKNCDCCNGEYIDSCFASDLEKILHRFKLGEKIVLEQFDSKDKITTDTYVILDTRRYVITMYEPILRKREISYDKALLYFRDLVKYREKDKLDSKLRRKEIFGE